jgi:hypothetical protein
MGCEISDAAGSGVANGRVAGLAADDWLPQFLQFRVDVF